VTVQNEVVWLLDTIDANYPSAFPDDLALRNRDEPRTRYPDGAGGFDLVREKGVSLDRWTVVGVASGSTTRELYGTKPQYDVETTLDVRVEAKADEEWGEMADVETFDTLVGYVQYAINQELSYPAVDTGDEDIGRVQYQDLGITDETNQSRENKDYYQTTFTVRLRGKQDTP
jgi:hypothetical protein